MIMRKLKDLPDDILYFIKTHVKLVVVVSILLVLTIVFFASFKNYYYGMLFYPDKTKTGLVYERRAIVYGSDRLDAINKILDELLLGPENRNYYNIFSRDSKLLYSRIENDILVINLSKDTVKNVPYEKNKKNSTFDLVIQSIVTTVCFHDKNIKKVKFYFDGEEYRFAGNIGDLSKGIKPDWNIFKF
jgi:hypothetical protein